MEIKGTTVLNAPPERVYQVFMDKDVLARATPGLTSMTEVAPNQYAAALKVGVAGISGQYKGTLQITDQDPPNAYTLIVDGEGAPGFVRGKGRFQFTPAAAGKTEINYTWDVQVGGIVAGVGQRVLGGVAKLLLGQFVNAIQKELGA